MLLATISLIQRSKAFLPKKCQYQYGLLSGRTFPSSSKTRCAKISHYRGISTIGEDRSSSTSTFPSPSSLRSSSTFLHQVEETIKKVHESQPPSGIDDVHTLEPNLREAVGIANRLSKRIHNLHKNNDCPTCWLQAKHCICNEVQPIDGSNSNSNSNNDDLIPSNVNRLFMIMHHKEIGLVVDTAKVLLNSMPSKARLVVSGIGEEYQDSMDELLDAMKQKDRRCIVLFPTDDARTFEELILVDSDSASREKKNHQATNDTSRYSDSDTSVKGDGKMEMFDVIVMDGTWSQARKIHSRYIPLEKDGGPPRVCLSQESLDILGSPILEEEMHTINGTQRGGSGRQLRRHPIKWKEVSTLEATRLLLRDMLSLTGEGEIKRNNEGKACHDILSEYQQMSDSAAVKQLGPPRRKDLNRS